MSQWNSSSVLPQPPTAVPAKAVPATETKPPSGTGPLSGAGVTAALRSRGLRATAPRLEVYRALAACGGHRSADDLAGLVAESGGSVQRTSVYNALRALVEAGVVEVVQAGPGTTLYELHADDHHHFLCRSCGSLTDVPAGQEVPALLQVQIPGARVDSAQVILRGLCTGCLRR